MEPGTSREYGRETKPTQFNSVYVLATIKQSSCAMEVQDIMRGYLLIRPKEHRLSLTKHFTSLY